MYQFYTEIGFDYMALLQLHERAAAAIKFWQVSYSFQQKV